MKRLIFIIVSIIINISTFSQDEKKENVILPNNRVALNDLFEEYKQKINEADIKIKSLNKYSQILLDYKNKIYSLDASKIETIYVDITTAISNKKNDEVLSQEEVLTNYLQSFYFTYSSRLIFGDEESPVSREFVDRINIALGPIKSNPIVKKIIDAQFNASEKTTIDDEKLPKLKSDINSASITNIKSNLISIVDNEISLNKKNLETSQSELQSIKSTRSRILEKLNEQETQINDLAIKLGLPLFCLTILLLFIVPSLIKTNVQSNSQNVLLEISTVLLLTMSILILGLSGKIQSDVLGTLIGGISGYVLNRIRSRSDTPAPS